MIWTEVEKQIAIENRGLLSAAQIAALIGHGLTRNAVIGQWNRMGLEKLARPVAKPKPLRLPRKEPKTRTAPVKEFVSPPIPVAPLNIPFLGLGPTHCREIVGSEGPGMSLSCGHPVITESSFCRWHHSINYISRAA